jgi:hypothetical protein
MIRASLRDVSLTDRKADVARAWADLVARASRRRV